MNLQTFQLNQLNWCTKIGVKSCKRRRNLKSDYCAHCVLDYLDAMATLEKYDSKEAVTNQPPVFPSVSDEIIQSGIDELLGLVRSGAAKETYPVGARFVIGDQIFEVMDYDTVKVSGKEHTLTLRLFTRDYAEIPFDSANGGVEWCKSSIRTWLNAKFLGQIRAPLRNAILEVENHTISKVKMCPKCGSETCNCGCRDGVEYTEVTRVSYEKVWLPSVGQLGIIDDDREGDVLDAFDKDLCFTASAKRAICEYHGDEVVPKPYWIRSQYENANGIRVLIIGKNGELSHMEDTYETTAMAIPYITIG